MRFLRFYVSACQNGEFTDGIGATECRTCPVSRVDFNGWFCMSEAQKIVFVGGWILSIFSIVLTTIKIYRWQDSRKKMLREKGVPINMKNIFLYKKPKSSYPLIQRSYFDETERMRILEEMVNELRNEVDKLKQK